jgi:1-acyl-sn-glycerol-3-phosphate acyltransferase
MAAASPRPIRFIMDHRVFATPVLGLIFRLAKTIPIAPQREDPEIYERAFATAKQVLDEGDLLCIYPEGVITRDGKMGGFKGGIMKILQANPVPVVPMALQTLWGSFFSRIDGAAMSRPFRRGFFNRVNLVVAPALPAEEVSPAGLQTLVQQLHDGPPGAG